MSNTSFLYHLHPTLIPKCYLYIKHVARDPYVALDRSKYGLPQVTWIQQLFAVECICYIIYIL